MPYAAGLATALLLSGCGGSAPPAGPATVPLVAQSDSPTVASEGTATTSATTTPEDPVLARIPKAARPNTQAGAEAFAKFFIEQVALAGVAAEPSMIDGLYNESCKTCQNFTKTLEGFQGEQRHHRKPALTVTATTVYTWIDDRRVVGVGVDQRAVDILDSAGKAVGRTDLGEGTFHVALRYGSHWQVIAVGVEE